MKGTNNTRKYNDQRTEGVLKSLSFKNYSKNCFLIIRNIPSGIVTNTLDNCNILAKYTAYKWFSLKIYISTIFRKSKSSVSMKHVL